MKWRLGYLLFGVMVCVIMLTPRPAGAVQASIQVLANVVSSLSVSGTDNLDFGSVTPGVSKGVDHLTSPDAGVWNITGAGSPEVQLSFTNLPGQLASGTDVMNVTYTASSGTTQATSTDIPILAAGATTNLIAGVLDVWLGGTVFPGATQPGGAYSATVVLEVTLTGN